VSIVGAQWAWIGSESKAKMLVRSLRRRWRARHVPGEGYRFDYEKDGGEFRDGLDQCFLDVVGGQAMWEKLGPGALRLLRLQAGRGVKRA
jgi:hypothetical protein